jgi:hypothetical protein
MVYLSLWELCEGNLKGWSTFTGDPKVYVKEGSGKGHLSPCRPCGGIWRGPLYQKL